MNQYIVYQLIDPRDNIQYYIGFGKDPDRPYSHLEECKRWLNGRKLRHPNYFKLARIRDIIADGYDYVAEIIFSFTNSDEAYNKEVELIARYGRLDLGTGILTNMNAGGKGLIDPSPEVRTRIAEGNRRPLKEKWSNESYNAWKDTVNSRLADPAYMEKLREGGRRGAKHIIENGWSNEAIFKRTQTRKATSGFSTDMSACHTKEAIARRVMTRRATSGFSPDTSACHTDEARFKRERTKILGVINRIQAHYQEPFTLILLKRAHRDRVAYLQESTVRKYLTVDEINSYSTGAP